MKFKLDENLGRAAAAVLLEAGFDVLTISDQQMQGALDRDVIECCVREERCLVTLDADVGDHQQVDGDSRTTPLGTPSTTAASVGACYPAGDVESFIP